MAGGNGKKRVDGMVWESAGGWTAAALAAAAAAAAAVGYDRCRG